MSSTPFRSCDYCGITRNSDLAEPRLARRAWTIFNTTRKLACPRCQNKGRTEDNRLRLVIANHFGLLKNRLAADPVVAYTSRMKLQHGRIKEKYPDALVLFREGDAYHAFGDDADVCSYVLSLPLVKKPNLLAPYDRETSVPRDRFDEALPRLVHAGHRVAVCDNIQGPPVPDVVMEPVEQYRSLKRLYLDALLVLRDHQGYLMLYKDAQRAANVLHVEYPGNGPFRIAKSRLEHVLDELVKAGHRVAVVIDPKVDDPRNAKQVDLWDAVDTEATVVAEPPTPYTNNFTANLKHLRTRRGLSQQQLADALGVKRSTYSSWENGTAEPGLRHLLVIQHVHEIGLDVLLCATLHGYTAEDLERARGAFAPRPRVTLNAA